MLWASGVAIWIACMFAIDLSDDLSDDPKPGRHWGVAITIVVTSVSAAVVFCEAVEMMWRELGRYWTGVWTTMLAHILIALSLAWSGTISVGVAVAITPVLTNGLSLRRWLAQAMVTMLSGFFGLIAFLAGLVMAWRQLAG
jgi:hypothetical protein